MARAIAITFEEVVGKELATLYRVARRLTLNGPEAEDLVGQTLLNAAKAWSKFDGQYPRSWLLKILKNEHLGSLRKSAARPVTVSIGDRDAYDDGPWNAVDWQIVGSNIIEELDRLPEEYRLAVALCDVEEMSYEEAALAMSIPVGTVRSRLFRGRRILRNRLASLVDDKIEV